MIEDAFLSLPSEEVDGPSLGRYFFVHEKVSGQYIIIQRPNSNFYFLCTDDCDIDGLCCSYDWYIISKDRFNSNLYLGIGLADRDQAEGEVYRVVDEVTLQLWRDILLFTFESNFTRKFYPYDNHFGGKLRLDGSLCFYIHDYYPVAHKDLTLEQKKVSKLVFRFKEGQSGPLVAKLFSLAISRMPFYIEAQNPVLIPIPAATHERNQQRFASFCSQLSRRLNITDGYRAVWIKEDREQLKGTTGQNKLSNLIFQKEYIDGKDIFLVDDILTTGSSFIQTKRKLIKMGAHSVTGLFLAKTI